MGKQFSICGMVGASVFPDNINYIAASIEGNAVTKTYCKGSQWKTPLRQLVEIGAFEPFSGWEHIYRVERPELAVPKLSNERIQ